MRSLFLAAALSVLSVQSAPAATGADPAGSSAAFPVPVGATFRDGPLAPRLVVVPAGSYLMGASAEEARREGRRDETAAWERPQHRVVVPTQIAVGKDLVTREEFAAFVAATRRPMTKGCVVLDGTWQAEAQRGFTDPAFAQTDRDPAVCVAVDDAEAYAAWLSQTTGHAYRLLHEAEWEYVARAGSAASRWWGDDRASLCEHVNGADRSYHALYPADEHANVTCDDRFAHTSPAGAFAANPFGLDDMLGNVWQWTADCFVPGYAHAPTMAFSSIDAGDCSRRMIRGGSWHNAPDSLRAAARFWLPPDMRSSSVGFRIVRLPDAVAPPIAASPAAAQPPAPGAILRDCRDCAELVVVPPGRFVMGSNVDEQKRFGVSADYAATELPAHAVRIARAFAIGRTPVTRDAWAAYSAATSDDPAGCSVFSPDARAWGFDARRSWRDPGFVQGGDEPVVCVNLADAQRYAAWMSARTGERYRLPTEAEWEYAARAGTTGANYWGDTLDDACLHTNAADRTAVDRKVAIGDRPDLAFACADGHAFTAPVEAFPPNPFGLYGMSGNVNQIVADCFHASYDGARTDGGVWTDGDCRYHMDRGASWVNSPRFVRAGMRHKDLMDARVSVLGFRLVREITP